MEEFQIAELNNVIKTLDPTTSPGPDGIFGLMIVGLSKTAKLFLLNLFNHPWTLGKLPLEWKRAIVVTILKPRKEADNPENFRPIYLNCIPCKIMERIILDRLNFHLAENNLSPRVQYGFRKGHSTMDQILYFCQLIRDAQNNKPQHCCIT
ncbi:probable RNA-directed DNA polymerase from transposon BS [Trichonephila clavipes]|uniref:Probable RNA-directed DNA polymerase from transposon BS n=1 Tax=Trichonephila clavipes TaxID=2585209 RepID=A0A8X6WIK7_TRICX|nr:probable RNA-directed DNA polymerase from transposon BS [Trichonephila clavipes]